MYARKQLSGFCLMSLVGFTLLTGGGLFAQQDQCPSLKAIMVDPCSDDVNNEFIIIHSGTGFNTRDLQINFDSENNILVWENNDINVSIDNFSDDPRPCRFQPGNPSLIAGCPNVHVASQDQEIPPNAVVIIQISGAANEPFDFGFLCGSGECVYVLQNDCIRTTEAFRNKGAGTQSLQIALRGTSCSETSTYNRNLLDKGNGDFYAPDGTSLYGNRGCASSPWPSPPVGGAIIPPDFVQFALSGCPSVTLPAITGSNLTGNERYYTGPRGTGIEYTAGSLITRNLNLIIFDKTAPCSPEIPIRITIIDPVTPNLVVPTPVCEDAGPIPLETRQDNISGTWSGSGVINNVFHPDINRQGVYTLTFTPDAGECAIPNTTMLEVFPLPEATPGISAGACNAVGGQAAFDLTLLREGISGGASGQVRWFADAALNTQILDTFAYITRPPTIVYAVLDNGACSSDPVTVDLNIGPALEVNFASFKGLSCAGDTDGAIRLEIIGGTPPYTIVWSNPIYNGLDNITNLGSGVYAVTVTDAGGCSESKQTSLIEPPMLNFSCSALQDVSTVNGQDGSGTFSISGGIPPYRVAWFGPVSDSMLLTTASADVVISNLAAGTYNLIARDALGCLATCQYNLDLPNCDLEVTAIAVNPDCAGAATGSITLSTTGAQAGVNYTWNPSNLNGLSSATDLPAGLYEVSITDGVGCFRVLTFNLEAPPPLELNCEATINPPVQGAADGQGRVMIGGGKPPYTVTWTGPRNGDVTSGNPAAFFIDDLPAGTYEVLLTDANGCEERCSFVLSEGSCSNQLNSTISHETCPGVADGSIILTPAGAWVSPVDIDWSDDQYDGQTTLRDLSPGNYSVTVTGANGCGATAGFTIEAGTGLPDVDFPTSADVCAGSCATFPLSFSGTAPFFAEFFVRAGNQTIPINIDTDQSTATLILCPADYGIDTGSILLQLIRVSDANCINDQAKESRVEIYQAVETQLSPTLCFGESIEVNGQLYDADRPAGTEILSGAAQLGCDSIVYIDLQFAAAAIGQVIQTLCPGEHITVNGQRYDENRPSGTEIIPGTGGCDSTIIIDLSFYPPAVGLLERTLCPGEELVVNGHIYNEQQPTGTELFPGEGTNGCDSVLQVSLTYYPEAVGFFTSTICLGQEVMINGQVYDQNRLTGTEILSGMAEHGCDSIIQVELSFFDNPFTLLQDTLCSSGSMIVNGTVYDLDHPVGTEILAGQAANGCDSIVQVELSFYDSPIVLLRDTLCSSGSLTINGTIYDINNPSGIEQFGGLSDQGCDSLVQVELFFLPDITASIQGDTEICALDPVMLTFRIENAPGPVDIRYAVGSDSALWAFGIQDGDQITVMPGKTTTYTVLEVSMSPGYCNVRILENATVSVQPLFVDAMITSDYDGYGVSCIGERNGAAMAHVMAGQGPFRYSWQDGSTDSVRTNLAPGVYTVMVTDALGCTSEASVNLEAPPPITLKISTLSTDCTGGQSGAVIIDSVSGGNSFYFYAIDGAQLQPITQFPLVIGGLSSGRHTLTVSDEFGCSAMQDALIADFAPLELLLGPDKFIKYGESVRLDAEAGFPIASLIWTASDSMPPPNTLPVTVSPTATTTYTLTAYDERGCSVSDRIMVFVSRKGSVYVPTAFSPNNDGHNDRFYPFTDRNIKQIMEFRIFDRWGNLMHKAFNFQGNSEAFGWDGKFKNQLMDPAVFIYYMKAEYLDGKIEEFKGDFALVR